MIKLLAVLLLVAPACKAKEAAPPPPTTTAIPHLTGDPVGAIAEKRGAFAAITDPQAPPPPVARPPVPGSYQIIGHGSGAGPATSGPPLTLSIGKYTVGAGLDPALVRRLVRKNLAKVQYCFEKRRVAKPELAGTVTVRFVIDAGGAVKNASGSGLGDSEVETCAAEVMASTTFPTPSPGSEVAVSMPFTYRPND
jgi:outer membrane biosynthesis protein TonB